MRLLTICLNPAIDVSAKVDSVYPISKMRSHDQSVEPGGGGINVARVLKSLGSSPELVYLSGGAVGTLLDDLLVDYKLDTRCFKIDGSTRVSFNVNELSSHHDYRFVPDGPAVNAHSFQQLMGYLANSILDPQDIVVASGSLPRSVPDTAYAEMADIIAQHKARFILDSAGVGLSTTIASQFPIFLIKPSLNELQQLAGCKLGERAARDFTLSLIKDSNIDHVAVSMGSHGAFLASEQRVTRLPAYLVETHSAVGAGDSFLGGLVHYLASGFSIDSAFRFGMAAGAAAVMTPGCKLCEPEQVLSLFNSDHFNSDPPF